MIGGRRTLGLALLLAGAGLLGYTGVAYGRGALERDRARAEWDRLEARRAVRAVRQAADAGVRPSEPPLPGAPIARLRLPRVGIDEVVVQGVGGDQLDAGPGHVPQTPIPGLPGNAVLSAHRDRHFAALGGARLGDTVETQTEYGDARWVIVSRRVLSRDARLAVEFPEPRLTLTTCWPIRWFGPAPERLVLEARLVESRPE